MLRFLAGALALASFLVLPVDRVAALDYPAVTGKCLCGVIGWGMHFADCGRRICTRALCAKACAASRAKTSEAAPAGDWEISAARRVRHSHRPAGVEARFGTAPWDAEAPRKPSHEFRAIWSDAASAGEVTDVSSARRMPRVRIPDRDAGLYRQRYRGDAGRARGGLRSPAGMDIARAAEIDRDGRGYASAPAGLRAASGPTTHRRPAAVARRAIRGGLIGSIVNAALAGASIGMTAATILPHPAGCPRRAFCGCGVAVHVLGAPVRALWLARNWLRFPRAAPAPGMVAVHPGGHHVLAIERVIGNGYVVAFDPNSGGHLTRRHVRSIAGWPVVNPRG
jgi:hypothetical protein